MYVLCYLLEDYGRQKKGEKIELEIGDWRKKLRATFMYTQQKSNRDLVAMHENSADAANVECFLSLSSKDVGEAGGRQPSRLDVAASA